MTWRTLGFEIDIAEEGLRERLQKLGIPRSLIGGLISNTDFRMGPLGLLDHINLAFTMYLSRPEQAKYQGQRKTIFLAFYTKRDGKAAWKQAQRLLARSNPKKKSCCTVM